MKKVFGLVLLIFVVADGHVVPRWKRSTRSEYKMCVPEDLLDLCRQMSSQETKSPARIICIPARDRFECIEKIKQRVADFGTVDPEDMYVASKQPDQDFAIFEEIRTKEEPEAEFRYEAVAVIHKDLNISDIKQLKGLKSCHTGVGRNVGYKIPLTKLQKKGIIGNLNDPSLSPRENELKAFSNLFSKACIVGKWSEDPKLNLKWKKKYANLCELCEHPEICDYPDKFSGYEGALRCLAHNGGQIAWTKVIFVRKFFGLPVGTTPAQTSSENPENFVYLCPDGTRTPITGTPCRWAARPWQGYMANADVIKTADELRRKIENLDIVGSKIHAQWLEKVLELNDKTIPKENKIIPPGDYLDKANYTDVIERDYGPPFKTVRFCVTSKEELKKCQDLSLSAFSRNIRPRFGCIEEKNIFDCMKTIRDNGADIVTLDGGLADIAQRDFNLKPIVAEQYGRKGDAYYAVAVVKKSSKINNFADLRGTKSCHTGYGRTAGYVNPIFTLLEKNLIDKKNCPYPKALSEFFSSSCLPGASKLGLSEAQSQKLCQLCIGDRRDPLTKCTSDPRELYQGFTGAFRCLVESGDVAFTTDLAVPLNTDGKNQEEWARNLKSEDFELLCPDGGRKRIDQFEECHLGYAAPHMVMTSRSKSDTEIDEIQNLLISTSAQYTQRPDLFKLFGSFQGKRDLLFKDVAVGLVSMNQEGEALKEFSKILNTVNGCA